MATTFTALQLVYLAAQDPFDFAGITLNASEYWFFDQGGQGYFSYDGGVTHATPPASGWFAILPSELSSFYFIQADPVADYIAISVENPANSGFIYYPDVLDPSTAPPPPGVPPIIGITPLDADKNEGNSGITPFTFTITRSGLTNLTNSVTWTVGPGANPSANAADFAGGVFQQGVVTFGPNEAAKVVTVNVQGDTTVEQNENFVVTLSDATNGAMIDPQHPSAPGVIVNDDVGPPPVLSIAPLSANKAEGNSGATTPFTFTVTRTGNTTGVSTATWSVGAGANPAADGQDFVGGRLPSGVVAFAPGQTNQTVTVNVQGDTLYESNENFLVTLANPTGATIDSQHGSAAGVIQNDDPLPSDNVIFVDPLNAVKSAGGGSPISFTFTINRMLPLNATVNALTVNWAVSAGPGDPIDAAQFFGGQFPTGSVTFSAVQFPVIQQGATVLLYSQTVTIPVSGNINLLSPEEFTISLTGPSGVLRGGSVTIDPQDGSALGYILPNVVLPAVAGNVDEWILSGGNWLASAGPGSHPAGSVVAGVGDFTHSGTDGILWYNASTGDVDEWKISFGGWAGSVDLGGHPGNFQIAGIGDFNGDGTDDVLWTSVSGGGPVQTDIWELANGQWAASVSPGAHPAGYQVAAVGDWTGHGTDGILWYNPSTGDVDEWQLSNGQWAASVDLGAHPGNYQIAGVGDFFGNGIDDVLWTSVSANGQVQTDIWKLGSNGQWAASVSPGVHPAGYVVVGIGDFTGNGTDGILWQNTTTGDVDEWQLSNGQWAASVDLGTHPGNFQVAGVGDFTGTGTAGILWHSPS